MIRKKIRRVIVLTRPEGASGELVRALKAGGFEPYDLPCIRVAGRTLNAEETALLTRARENDWVVFTSANGVRHFIESAKSLRVAPRELLPPRVAAVGPATEKALREIGANPEFLPSRYTTETLGREFPDPRGQKILLLRSSIASNALEETLRSRGADVSNISIYSTDLVGETDPLCEEKFRRGEVESIVFTSASTVRGFLARIVDDAARSEAFRSDALCIGPVTAGAARTHGFENVREAREETSEGILVSLLETK